MKFSSVLLGTGLMLALSVSHGALIDRGNGMIYDDVQDLTWLQDARYAQTSGLKGYDFEDEFGRRYNTVDHLGRMNWQQANMWADQMTFGGYDDWRLPRSFRRSGFERIESELGYMFYVNLGNSGASIDGLPNRSPYGFLNSGPFSIRPGTNFWLQENEWTDAWTFIGSIGFQGTTFGGTTFSDAWLVRDGDVLKVPEPSGFALSIFGLAIAVSMGRLNRRRGW